MLPASPLKVPAAGGGDRGVDADDLAAQVDQRAAGVAGVDGRVGLHGVDVGGVVGRLPRRDRPVERADDAGGHRGAQPERRADGDHALPDPEPAGGAERGRAEAGRVGRVEHGQVVDRAASDDGRVVAVALLVDDLDGAVVLGGVGDHVVVGDDVALLVEDEAGARGPACLALELGGDLHRARAAARRRRRPRCRRRPTAAGATRCRRRRCRRRPCRGCRRSGHAPPGRRASRRPRRPHRGPGPARPRPATPSRSSAGGPAPRGGAGHRQRLRARGRELRPRAGARRSGGGRRAGRRAWGCGSHDGASLRGVGSTGGSTGGGAGGPATGVAGGTSGADPASVRRPQDSGWVGSPPSSGSGLGDASSWSFTTPSSPRSANRAGATPARGHRIGRSALQPGPGGGTGVGAGVTIWVVGTRRSNDGASAGAVPSASTPITAAPTAPPPRAARPSVDRRGPAGSAPAEQVARGHPAQRPQQVRRRLEPAWWRREAGQAGLDPALALDEVAAQVARVHVRPGALRLGRGELAVEQRADAGAEVGDRHHQPASCAWTGGPGGASGPAYRVRPERGGAVGQGGAQHGAAAVDAGADGAELGAEDLGDLVVGEPLDVAEHHGGPEVGWQRGQRLLDVVVEGPVGVGGVGGGAGAGRACRRAPRTGRRSGSAACAAPGRGRGWW